jgi:alpha-tubulin suppressor-like RCC1 family protein
LADGTLRCWGSNEFGQLGLGGISTTDEKVPVQVVGISTAVGISCGDGHTCALLADRTVRCFGSNSNGQLGNGGLGDGGTQNQSAPVAVTDSSGVELSGVSALSSGSFHTCALVSGGGVQCWGSNAFGAVGGDIGGDINLSAPNAVSGLAPISYLSAGYDHTFGSTASGAFFGLGSDLFGELCAGDDTAGHITAVPLALSSLQGAVSIGPGYAHNCALQANGAVVCCGDNSVGQLGNGDTSVLSSVTPVAVSGLPTIAANVPAGDQRALMALAYLLLVAGAYFVHRRQPV